MKWHTSHTDGRLRALLRRGVCHVAVLMLACFTLTVATAAVVIASSLIIHNDDAALVRQNYECEATCAWGMGRGISIIQGWMLNPALLPGSRSAARGLRGQTVGGLQV